MLRNLIYFIYPLIGNEEWLNALTELCGYLGAGTFNGRCLITVAGDKNTHPASRIRRQLKDYKVEYCEVDNDPVLGETPFLLPALQRLRSLKTDEITFYAHAKGVSRSKSKRRGIQQWRQRMLKYCLEDIGYTEKIMEKYGVAGCFRRIRSSQPRVDPPVDWHFAGSYYWLNHERLFSRDWERIHNSRWGVEAYPALQFGIKESFCFFADDFPISPYKLKSIRQWKKLDEAEKERSTFSV